MSRVCSVCGRGKMSGHNVSHSNRKTNRKFEVNLQKVDVENEGKQYICAKCLKTSKKDS